MVNREISGSGRINASIFVDGKSMMKDCSKSNTERRLVLEIKWIAFLVISAGILESVLLQCGHSSLKIFDVHGLAWLWLVGI